MTQWHTSKSTEQEKHAQAKKTQQAAFRKEWRTTVLHYTAKASNNVERIPCCTENAESRNTIPGLVPYKKTRITAETNAYPHTHAHANLHTIHARTHTHTLSFYIDLKRDAF